MTDLGLTGLAGRVGCACKVSAERLDDVLADDLRGAGDVGHFSVGASHLVGSVDVITPVVDDPADWGRVCAVHALSDIYAAGSEPVFALGILGWPDRLPPEPARVAVASAVEVLRGAGAAVGGGHSLSTSAPLLGFAVTGVATGQAMGPDGFEPGTLLCLTKPLGAGIVTAAPAFGEELGPGELDACVTSMATLNERASKVARSLGVRACTDVSGYGLLGACADAAQRSGVVVEVVAKEVPSLPGADRLVRAHVLPALADETWRWLERRGMLNSATAVAAAVRLCSPETSGGLLLGLSEQQAHEVCRQLPEAVIIGRVSEGLTQVQVV